MKWIEYYFLLSASFTRDDDVKEAGTSYSRIRSRPGRAYLRERGVRVGKKGLQVGSFENQPQSDQQIRSVVVRQFHRLLSPHRGRATFDTSWRVLFLHQCPPVPLVHVSKYWPDHLKKVNTVVSWSDAVVENLAFNRKNPLLRPDFPAWSPLSCWNVELMIKDWEVRW